MDYFFSICLGTEVRPSITLRLLTTKPEGGPRIPYAAVEEGGGEVPLDGLQNRMIFALAELQPMFDCQLVYSRSQLQKVHVFVDSVAFGEEMEEEGTVPMESRVVALIRDNVEALEFPPIVVGSFQQRDEESGKGITGALRWLQWTERAPVMRSMQAMEVGESGWVFDFQVSCFVKGYVSPLADVPLKTWILESALQDAISCFAVFETQTSSASEGTYILEEQWLMESSGSLYLCKDVSFDEWEAGMMETGRRVISVRTYSDLSRLTLADVAKAEVFLLCSDVLDDPFYTASVLRELGGHDIESARIFVRRTSASNKSLSSSPPLFHVFLWNRLVLDDLPYCIASPIQARGTWTTTECYGTLVEDCHFESWRHETLMKRYCASFCNRYMHCFSFLNTTLVERVEFEQERGGSDSFDDLAAHQWIGFEVLRETWILCVDKESDVLLTRRDAFAKRQIRKFVDGTETCSICMERRANSLFQCGHLFCHACTKRLVRPLHLHAGVTVLDKKCAVCRQEANVCYSVETVPSSRNDFVASFCERQARKGESVLLLSHWETALDFCAQRLRKEGIVVFCGDVQNHRQPIPGTVTAVCVGQLSRVPRLRADVAVWMHCPFFLTRELHAFTFNRLGGLVGRLVVVVSDAGKEEELFRDAFQTAGEDKYAVRDCLSPPSDLYH